MFSGLRERVVGKLSEALAARQRPQVYQIADQWTHLLLKLLKESPVQKDSWHTHRCALNRAYENKSHTRFLFPLSLIAEIRLFITVSFSVFQK